MIDNHAVYIFTLHSNFIFGIVFVTQRLKRQKIKNTSTLYLTSL